MAGLGYKDFTAGAVLTAAQVDGYLMEQAVMNFAGTAARGSALSAVQAAGMVAHVGGGTLTVATSGSAWAEIYPGTSSGLTFITSGTLSSTATSFNNVFSSTYVNYRILVARADTSTAATPALRLRVSGVDATTNYAYQLLSASSTTVSGSRSTAQTSYRYASVNSGADNNAVVIDIFTPNIACNTHIMAMSVNTSATPVMEFYFGAHETATAYDGITFFPSTGNWDTGTVSIYGYR